MRILICHGYLLKGTGSNQYVQSLARSLCRQGHHLVVVCQDSDPQLDFVSVFLRGSAGGANPEVVWERDTDYPGTCMVFQPDIEGLLPVYVLDSYEGFEVKEFPDLSDGELQRYIESNRQALSRLVEQFAPAGIQVNHAVMLPHIVRPVAERAGVPYAVSIHGSEIDFTVRRDARYLEYGADGLAGAASIIAPSEHTALVTEEVFGELVEGIEDRMQIMPPGVDTELFRPTREGLPESVHELLEQVERRTSRVAVGDFAGRGLALESPANIDELIGLEAERVNATHPDWLPEADIAERLAELAESGAPYLMFLGKLLETKGIQCVLPALPLVLADHPRVRLVVVGFGELRGLLQLMLDALDEGNLLRLRAICDYGDRTYGRVKVAFAPVTAFLDRLADDGALDDYNALCRAYDLNRAVTFTGYLTPLEHRHLLGHAAALLVPSVAPEAFGLVATEAMACGVVPIASRHSGLAAALAPLEDLLGPEAESLSLTPGPQMVRRIASASCKVLAMAPDTTDQLGRAMREVVTRCFSWDAFADRLVSEFEEA